MPFPRKRLMCDAFSHYHMNENGRRKQDQGRLRYSRYKWVALRQWSLPKTHGSQNTKMKSRDQVGRFQALVGVPPRLGLAQG